jgi:hypothetical protein
MQSAPFPFVVGCTRSGTTLVRSILDTHPDVAFAPEAPAFAAWFADRRGRYETGGGFDADRFRADVVARPFFDRWELSTDELDAALASADPTDVAAALRAVYALHAARRGKSRYGDKTPRNVHSIDGIARLLPETVFVHVVRDGRDVTRSLMAVDWGSSTPGEAMLHWRVAIEAGRAAGGRVGPGRYREVRYEALVAEPEPVVRELCRFVGLDYDPAMLRYYERSDLPGREAKDHHRLGEPPRKAPTDWRTHMSARQVEVLEAIAGPTLAECGYPLANPRPSTSARLRAALALAGAKTRRVGRRGRVKAALSWRRVARRSHPR